MDHLLFLHLSIYADRLRRRLDDPLQRLDRHGPPRRADGWPRPRLPRLFRRRGAPGGVTDPAAGRGPEALPSCR
jgi:hypothetical protein